MCGANAARRARTTDRFGHTVAGLQAAELLSGPDFTSQRSLHNAPIFRLLLKVAVNGTHQCDFLNFCGASGLQCGGNTLQWNLAWPWGCGALTLL